MDKLVITRLQGKICTTSVSDRKVTGITLEEEDKASILNNIYIGKVQKVVTGINAAFVDLGVTIGYYSLDENKEHLFTQQGRNGKLRPGDEILVQVSRDAVKTKAPVLTANLSLPGRFCVLTAGSDVFLLSFTNSFISRLVMTIPPYYTNTEQHNALLRIGYLNFIRINPYCP